MRRRITVTATAGVVVAGVGVGLAFGLPSVAAQSVHGSPGGPHCPVHAKVLPADAVARAADQARIEAGHVYPGFGPAQVTQSSLASYAGARGREVKRQCGSRAFRRTVVVDLQFPKELPSASLSEGTVFVSLFATGYRVWEMAH